MDNPKIQLVDRIKEANNVLVTVSNNPSVDQLSAAIGLTLLLNKLGKHATAVFSGDIPSTIEFLKPDETIERNTDSLRDFIIALDKSKADKLRYKVEDKMVKIFITPYRTSITDQDLEFSQGDFNVDVVVGLGVKVREDLDQAITSHGRILHDATVASINTVEAGSLGTMNWVDPSASSLSEMIVAMIDMLKSDELDAQIATALLTGIVAETERFSNAKTTSNTMNASAKLMAAGANQQLVATKLDEPAPEPQPAETQEVQTDDQFIPEEEATSRDGSLQIEHNEAEELPEPQSDESDAEDGQQTDDIAPDDDHSQSEVNNRIILDPPSMGGQLTANTETESYDPSVDPISAASRDVPMLSHDSGPALDDSPHPDEAPEDTPTENPSEIPDETPPVEADYSDQTLSEVEESVDSPHLDETPQETPVSDTDNSDQLSEVPPEQVDSARDAVQAAINNAPDAPLEPIVALNAQPGLELNHDYVAPPPVNEELSPEEITPPAVNIDQDGTLKYDDILTSNSPLEEVPGMPTNLVPPVPAMPSDPTAASVNDPNAPPPVPPPMMPPIYDPNSVPQAAPNEPTPNPFNNPPQQ